MVNTSVYGCTRAYMGVHGHTWVYTGIHGCTPVYARVHLCILMFTMYTHVCLAYIYIVVFTLCAPVFIMCSLAYRTLVYDHVHHLYTCVSLCTPVFTCVQPCIHPCSPVYTHVHLYNIVNIVIITDSCLMIDFVYFLVMLNRITKKLHVLTRHTHVQDASRACNKLLVTDSLKV